MKLSTKIAKHIDTRIDNWETSRALAEELVQLMNQELSDLLFDAEGDWDMIPFLQDRRWK